MGEANYYLKARFVSEAEAEAALPKFKEFLRQAGEVHNLWQADRMKPKPDFYEKIRAEFPIVYEYLKTLPGALEADFDRLNGLAGLLSFGNVETEPEVVNDEIRYWEYTWHFGDWYPLCRFIESHFGAEASAYISDEYADMFDCVHV